MLQTTFLEFLLRGIPEAILLVLSSYIFIKKKIMIIEFIKVTSILAFIAYGVRFLPINYGVHTILNVFAFLALSIIIMNNNYLAAMKNAIFIFVTQSVCEAINLLFVKSIFDIDMHTLFNDSRLKLVYGIPSTVMLFAIILLLYIVTIKKGEKVQNGGNIKENKC